MRINLISQTCLLMMLKMMAMQSVNQHRKTQKMETVVHGRNKIVGRIRTL